MTGTGSGNFPTNEFAANAIFIQLIYVYCLTKDISDLVVNLAAVAGVSIGVKFKAIRYRLKISPIVKFIPVEIEVVGSWGCIVSIKCFNAHKIRMVIKDARVRHVAYRNLVSLTFPFLIPVESVVVETDTRSVPRVAPAGGTLEFDTQSCFAINLEPRCRVRQFYRNIFSVSTTESNAEIVVCKFRFNVIAVQDIMVPVLFKASAR